MKKRGAPDTRQQWVASLWPWLTLGVLGVYMKHAMMASYWYAIARFLKAASPEALGLMPRLQLYAQDVLFNLALLPLLMASVLVLMTRHAARWSHLLAGALFALYFFQLQSQQQLGQYVSVDLVIEAARWAALNPESGLSYVPLMAMVKLATLFSLGLLASWLHARWSPTQAARRASPMQVATVIGLIALSGAALALTATVQKGSLYQASSAHMLWNLIPSPHGPHLAKAQASGDAARQFRAMTRTPDTDERIAHLGQAKDANVLLFILETGALGVYEPGETPLSQVTPRLRQHMLTSTLHKTSYPYTSDALFSILSGLYPEGRRVMVAHGTRQTLPSLMSPLSAQGYLTKAYMPDLYNDEVDDRMFSRLGFDAQYVADRSPDLAQQAAAHEAAQALAQSLIAQAPHFKAKRRGELVKRLTLDIMALNALKADIVLAGTQRRHFGLMFLPQIGHAPWLELGAEDNVRSHGKAIMALQARWINELSALLERQQVLDQTVLVVTGDHGVRTRTEDPSLNVGTTDHYSFAVPLMLHAPKAWPQGQTLPHITSHVDIAPSVLALLGLEKAAAGMEGGPLWAIPEQRRTFFFATGYGGAVGFHESQFVMHNIVSGFVYANTEMRFADQHLLSDTDGALAHHVQQAFDAFRVTHGNVVEAAMR